VDVVLAVDVGDGSAPLSGGRFKPVAGLKRRVSCCAAAAAAAAAGVAAVRGHLYTGHLRIAGVSYMKNGRKPRRCSPPPPCEDAAGGGMTRAALAVRDILPTFAWRR